ncbi:uncharacterized protein [Palaemon carinicauda]|uniref:uncharacterized protein n=1 Tax=Palaemon carinicauda TaxID=392227 RepID=UPI0035B637A9
MFQDSHGAYAVLPSVIRPRRIQPGKKTILVSVLLSTLLLMSQLLRALQLEQPPKLTNVHILQSLTSLNEETGPSPCIKTNLGNERDSRLLSNQTCQHLPPSRGLCSLTQNLFFSKKPHDCTEQTTVTFCKMDDDYIHCESPAVCANLNYYLGTFSEEVAKVQWKLILRQNLQEEVSKYAFQSKSYGFLFIRCASNSDIEEDLGQPQYDEAYVEQNLIHHTQLFLFPPNTGKVKTIKKTEINVNLLMVDSLSRAHFYRSLPNTVQLLEELSESSTTKILDFQLFQAVKQRTFESLQALFSGYVDTLEVPFGMYDVPRVPLSIEKLYGKFKEKGYRTLWLEDLCWNWEWGLVKDLKVMNTTLEDVVLWKNFKKALDIANIDGVDLTLSSCDILFANGKKDPFRNLPAVCYNGHYHHEYILEYLELYQKSMQKSGSPFISYTMTSVSHEESGIRVQSLDDPLMKYLKFASKLEDTITILFSDHGNTYGKFIESSPEAYAESFNPMLFMLIPINVQKALGDVRMRILKDNEKRLVSLLDLHYMLIEVIKEKVHELEPGFEKRYVIPGGLLSNIPQTRTCQDIPLLQPNLCICKNYETSVEPSSLHMALADYGVGILNNMILSQHRKDGKSGFGNCLPMKPVEIRKVFEVHTAVDLVIYKIDLLVQSAENKTSKDIFFLSLEVGRKNPGIRLTSYERFSVYGMYDKCRDKSVELKLCVCNIEKAKYKSSLLSSLLFGNLLPDLSFLNKNRDISDQNLIQFLISPVFGTNLEIDFSYPNENPCMYTVICRYKLGITLKALNFCSDFHKVEIRVNAKNMLLSSDKHSNFLLYPRDVKVLMAGVVANPKIEWRWDHSIKVY